MPTLADLKTDPEFYKLPPHDKAAVLSNIDPDFIKLGGDEQQAVVQHLDHFPSQQEWFGGNTSQYAPAIDAETVQKSPDYSPDATIQAPHFGPIQHAMNIGQGVMHGIGRGIIPYEEGNNDYRSDPAAQTAENWARGITNFGAQVGLAIPTGGAYNAGYNAVSSKQESDRAIQEAQARLVDDYHYHPEAVQGDQATLERIKGAQGPASVLSGALGYASMKVPSTLGTGLAPKIASGLGIGYINDMAGRAIGQYGQTGGVNPAQMDWKPGLNTAIGGALGVVSHPAIVEPVKKFMGAEATPQPEVPFQEAMPQDTPIGLAQINKNNAGQDVETSVSAKIAPTEDVQPTGLMDRIKGMFNEIKGNLTGDKRKDQAAIEQGMTEMVNTQDEAPTDLSQLHQDYAAQRYEQDQTPGKMIYKQLVKSAKKQAAKIIERKEYAQGLADRPGITPEQKALYENVAKYSDSDMETLGQAFAFEQHPAMLKKQAALQRLKTQQDAKTNQQLNQEGDAARQQEMDALKQDIIARSQEQGAQEAATVQQTQTEQQLSAAIQDVVSKETAPKVGTDIELYARKGANPLTQAMDETRAAQARVRAQEAALKVPKRVTQKEAPQNDQTLYGMAEAESRPQDETPQPEAKPPGESTQPADQDVKKALDDIFPEQLKPDDDFLTPAEENTRPASFRAGLKAQKADNPAGYDTAAQVHHEQHKTFEEVMQDKLAAKAFVNLPDATKEQIKNFTATAQKGARADIFGFHAATGEMSSGQEGLNLKPFGDEDKTVTPIGLSFNAKNGKFYGHAINNNFETRTYPFKRSANDTGISELSPNMGESGLVGKHANVYYQAGKHVPLHQYVSHVLNRLPDKIIDDFVDNGKEGVSANSRSLLSTAIKTSGPKLKGDTRAEVFNHVQEALTNRATMRDTVIDMMPPDVLKAFKGDSVEDMRTARVKLPAEVKRLLAKFTRCK